MGIRVNGRRKKKHGSRHHIVPRSVGGPNIPENIYHWTKKKHSAYHQLFYNYLPSHAIEKINFWTDQNGKLKTDLMGPGKVKAWEDVFNGGAPGQAIKFIRKNFLPAELKFLRGELGGGYEKDR